MGDSGWVSFDPSDPSRAVTEAMNAAIYEKFNAAVPDTIPPHLPEGALRPNLKGSDPDYGVILSFDLRNERITFASHDRHSHVSMDWEALTKHAGEMTAREWKNINDGLRKYAGTGHSVVSVNSTPGKPSPVLVAQAAGIAREAEALQSVREQAKGVMNALTALGATTDDALAIILSEISAADDPREAAAMWVTRFTDDVMAVLREYDAEQG
jgi:hypothetical protein